MKIYKFNELPDNVKKLVAVKCHLNNNNIDYVSNCQGYLSEWISYFKTINMYSNEVKEELFILSMGNNETI